MVRAGGNDDGQELEVGDRVELDREYDDRTWAVAGHVGSSEVTLFEIDDYSGAMVAGSEKVVELSEVEPVERDSVEVVDCRTPPLYRDDPKTFTVAVGDTVTTGTQFRLEVTDVSHDGDGESVKITAEHGEFTIVIEDGVWECQECYRPVAHPYHGSDKCEWCHEQSRRHRDRRPEQKPHDIEDEDESEEMLR